MSLWSSGYKTTKLKECQCCQNQPKKMKLHHSFQAHYQIQCFQKNHMTSIIYLNSATNHVFHLFKDNVFSSKNFLATLVNGGVRWRSTVQGVPRVVVILRYPLSRLIFDIQLWYWTHYKRGRSTFYENESRYLNKSTVVVVFKLEILAKICTFSHFF